MSARRDRRRTHRAGLLAGSIQRKHLFTSSHRHRAAVERVLERVLNPARLRLADPGTLDKLLGRGLRDTRKRREGRLERRDVRLVDRADGRERGAQDGHVVLVDALADGVGRLVLVHFERGEIQAAFLGRPGDDDGHIIDEADLGQFADGILVLSDVAVNEQYAEHVHVSESLDARVDVFGMKTVVLETQKERACRSAYLEVWNYVGPFLGHVADVFQHRIPSLAGVHKYRAT